MSERQWVPWLLRAAWLTLPATVGTLLGHAFDDRSAAVASTAAALAWGAWAVGVTAVALPRPAGVVAVRVVALAAVVAGIWAAADTGRDPLLVVAAAVPALVVLLPAAGTWLVNGAAYGDERRHLLRLPGALVLGPVPIAAVALMLAVTTGPLLLAARQWLVGGLVLAASVPVAVISWRALASLTTRWVVLVPAGLVVKDHVVLADPMLFRRAEIAWLGAADADTTAVDLTAGAPGLAVELHLRAGHEVVRVAGRAQPEPVRLDALLVTPTRPGLLVREAAERRIPIR